MKIGKETIKGLVQRDLATGRYYYWYPDPRERAAKWPSKPLGTDIVVAITAAKKINAEVAAWRSGGAKPAIVKQHIAKQDFRHVLRRYTAEVLSKKSANTQRVDRTALNRLEAWAGAKPWRWIDRARVRTLRDTLMAGVELNGPGHAPVFHLLTTLRKILAWWIKDQDLENSWRNPAAEFDLPAPAPRDQIWTPEAQAAVIAAATAKGLHSIALAFRIATYTGQRQADVLSLTRSQWREITLRQLDNDLAAWDALKSDHGPDAGKVMGIYVRQGKTKKWIGIPVEGDMRVAIEAAIAAGIERARKTGNLASAQLIVQDNSGEPWKQRYFSEKFDETRASAREKAIDSGDDVLLDQLEGLEFRDLRRTCIVTLGQIGLNDYQIASMSGHTQATIKKILEVYMPRTEAAAGRAVVARIGDRKPPAPKAENG